MERKMIFKKLIYGAVLVSLPLCASVADSTLPPPVKQYIQQISNQYDFDPAQLTHLFQQVHYAPACVHSMNHPFEAQPWDYYQHYFVTVKRVREGIYFWGQHQTELQNASQQYGVPAEIMVAITGIETYYGQHIGPYKAFNTLATLAFNYPTREKFFRNELTQYLLLSRDENFSPLDLESSYAGALGIPQFMPSTYRHFAVSEQPKALPNLFTNPGDAFASIGNYLKQCGWRSGEPIAVPLYLRQVPQQLVSKSGRPNHTVGELRQYGLKLPRELDNNTRVAIVRLNLSGHQNPEYWLTFNNFAAILSYNPSTDYAMAVFQLGNTLRYYAPRRYS